VTFRFTLNTLIYMYYLHCWENGVLQPSRRYFSSECVNFTDEGEPQGFMEAIKTTNKEKWMQSMEKEMQSLKKNKTYDPVKLPDEKRALKNKWVFKLKSEENNPNPGTKNELS